MADQKNNDDWNLFNSHNRSNSIDTDYYMRHLQRKSHNYDKLRGLKRKDSEDLDIFKSKPSRSLNNLGRSLRNKESMSLFERKMHLMDFLENARTSNPIRIAKLQDMIDQAGSDPRARDEIRQML